MTAILQDIDNMDVVPDNVVSRLTLPDDESLRGMFLANVQGFTTTQRTVIRDFLKLLSGGLDGWDGLGWPEEALSRYWDASVTDLN
jgi:hypothetical protein